MQLSQDAIEDRLEGWPVARLASRGEDGRPHQVPIVFARSGGRLWSGVDGKPKGEGELVRVRNLLARPEVSLLLDEYSADWTQLWWIRIEATGEILRPDSADSGEAGDPGEVSKAVAALEAKYPQYANVSVLRDPRTLIAFSPTRVLSWTAGA
jgi:PPOX class probable F420-dependent enzyme